MKRETEPHGRREGEKTKKRTSRIALYFSEKEEKKKRRRGDFLFSHKQKQRHHPGPLTISALSGLTAFAPLFHFFLSGRSVFELLFSSQGTEKTYDQKKRGRDLLRLSRERHNPTFVEKVRYIVALVLRSGVPMLRRKKALHESAFAPG